jgi:DNA-binding NarL/FixJ family response regulator
MIRVVIADDHPVFRRGLRGVLEEAEDILVVAEATDGVDAVALAVQHTADVVLMDLHMQGADGIRATSELAAQRPQTAVVALTMAEDDTSVVAALRAGAKGYLVKGASGEAILSAVRTAAAGDTVFGAGIAPLVMARLAASQARRQGPFPDLTRREEEILDLVARGWSNPRISTHLVLSDKTVRNHISNVFAKLGVPDRAAAIVLAREHGLGEEARQ